MKASVLMLGKWWILRLVLPSRDIKLNILLLCWEAHQSECLPMDLVKLRHSAFVLTKQRKLRSSFLSLTGQLKQWSERKVSEKSSFWNGSEARSMIELLLPLYIQESLLKPLLKSWKSRNLNRSKVNLKVSTQLRCLKLLLRHLEWVLMILCV